MADLEQVPESGQSISSDRSAGSLEPAPKSTTLGTGSVLGIGCLIGVILLVMVAVAFRLMAAW